MWTIIRSFVTALLFDPAAAQRYLAAGLYLVGEFLASGGVIPGTTTVIPIDVGSWASVGALCKAGAFYLGAGGGLPSPIRAAKVAANGG